MFNVYVVLCLVMPQALVIPSLCIMHKLHGKFKILFNPFTISDELLPQIKKAYMFCSICKPIILLNINFPLIH